MEKKKKWWDEKSSFLERQIDSVKFMDTFFYRQEMSKFIVINYSEKK